MLRVCVVSLVLGVLSFNSSLRAQQPAAPQAAAQHIHPAHGPHNGELLEIGNEEYHAEVIVDEQKKQLVVFLLDGHVKSYVTIDSPHIAVNLKLAGKPMQFKLQPIPQKSDQQGFSSCFGAASPDLVGGLHDPKSDPRLSLKIGTKSYTVKLVHDHNHNHAGHDHVGHAHAGSPKKF